MRHFDLVETPLTGKTFLEDGTNRIPASDSRVEVYFQSIDKVKYDRGFDTEGYPILLEYALQEDGTRYSQYLTEPDEDGVYQPDLEAITTSKLLEDSATVKAKIDYLIQEEIDTCNELKGLSFDGADAFAKYAINPNSDKQEVSLVFIKWIDSVWSASRAYKLKIANGEAPYPESVDEFIEGATLPDIGDY